ncbi:MAG: helix-turn-helix domain-containing protein [Proteobacteria bacterium]|nr:helix-turn-helix domain-containing protein [Pseudomonadota bacterium]
MLKPISDRWNQTAADLWDLSVKSSHRRTRERFSALFRILSEGRSATAIAASIGRSDRTVMLWVHLYNMRGPAALVYSRSGGKFPLFRRAKSRD